jgi:hypothetical protein
VALPVDTGTNAATVKHGCKLPGRDFPKLRHDLVNVWQQGSSQSDGSLDGPGAIRHAVTAVTSHQRTLKP